MTLTVIGVVIGPLLLMLVAVFVLQGKGRQSVLIISGILFFLTALFQFFYPGDMGFISVPQVLWKLLTLLTVMVVFIITMRDRQFMASTLIFIQVLVLILMEISSSPDEPILFLQLQADGKLLFLVGAFIFAVSLPVILQHSNRRFQQVKLQDKRIREYYAGLFLLMAAFAGVLSAKSITGLFLFSQWAYLANDCLQKAFGQQGVKKGQITPILQQFALTMWIVVWALMCRNNGSLAVEDLTGIGPASGLILVLIFLAVFVTGKLIPEKWMTKPFSAFPVPVAGVSRLLFSLLIPFSVLLKFRPLILTVDNRLVSLVVFLGSLLMAANAYYAGVSRRSEEIPSHMVLFVSGWGIVSAFTGGLEGIFFAYSYITATGVAIAFLYNRFSAQNSVEGSDGGQQAPQYLILLTIVTLILFIFAPFTSSLLSLVIIQIMSAHALAMLLAVLGIILIMAVIIRWLLELMPSGKKPVTEKRIPDAAKVILPFFFAVMTGLNLLPGTIYRYLQSQPLAMGVQSAADLEKYADLPGIIDLFKLGTGSIFVVLSIVVVVSSFFVLVPSGRKTHEIEQSRDISSYSLTAWLPSELRIALWIRAAWIMTVTLLVGVGLSCLKV